MGNHTSQDNAVQSLIRARLIANMSALITVLETHNVRDWAQAISNYLVGIRALNPSTVIQFAAHNRSGFAGILDLVICRDNHHNITVKNELAVDKQLTRLRTAVVEDVNKLENLLFNVLDPKNAKYLCPVCGCTESFHGDSFDERGGVIGTGICRCCFYEPGFDDDPMAIAQAKSTVIASIDAYYQRWNASGRTWASTKHPALSQTAIDQQVANLKIIAPHLPQFSQD